MGQHKTAIMERQMSLFNMPEMLTAKELEALLKIDVKTIYTYVQRGLIPYVRIQSNVRFPKQQILAWIEEHNFRPRLRKAALSAVDEGRSKKALPESSPQSF